MRYRKFIPVAVAMAAAAVLGACTSVASADVQPNVIGGNPPTHDYPAGAYVSLKYDAPDFGRTNWHTCGGALTFNNLVRTAAHCVTNLPAGLSAEQQSRLARSFHMDSTTFAIPVEAKSFWVRVGSQDKEAGGIVARATIKWVHPNWNWQVDPNVSNDIAILELDQYVDVYTLPLAPRAAGPGETVYRLGWGVTLPNGQGPLPSQIQELRSQIVHLVNCEPEHAYGWTPRDVCVGNVNGTDGACYGDSGGPVVIKIKGVWYDAGATSRGVADHCGAKPDIYTSTPEFRTEIYDVARGTPAVAKDQSTVATTSGERP